MRRREFITFLGSAAACPLSARAQLAKMPVIGLLSGESADASANLVLAFKQGLEETGFVEGQNVSIQYRWAEGHDDRLPSLAADLVKHEVAVIAATAGGGTAASLAAKAATTKIPVIFTSGADPVRLGLVASLNRPGGNITGIAWLSLALDAKRLDLLRELLPKISNVAVLLNPNFPDTTHQTHEIYEAAQKIEQRITILNASTLAEIDAAFETVTRIGAGALLVGSDPFLISQRQELIALAARHAIPAIYEDRVFTMAGGLLSYGASFADAVRQVGIYTGRVLKGEKPENLPVLQPTKFELVINLNTATTLGLTVPPSLLVRADEVIE